MKKVKLKIPKKLKTAYLILGVNVQGKDVIEVSQERISLFKELGFKEIKDKKEKK